MSTVEQKQQQKQWRTYKQKSTGHVSVSTQDVRHVKRQLFKDNVLHEQKLFHDTECKQNCAEKPLLCMHKMVDVATEDVQNCAEKTPPFVHQVVDVETTYVPSSISDPAILQSPSSLLSTKHLTLKTEKTKKKCEEAYWKQVRQMPIYVCTCDHRLLYRTSVQKFNLSNYDFSHPSVSRALHSSLRCQSSDGHEYICKTCHSDLLGKGKSKHKVPVMPCQAVANDLQLASIPAELQDLNDLERRFIGLRIVFMKLVALPKGGQYGISGDCVNVPAKVTAMCTLLPRMPEAVQLVTFKLKRKLMYKGHHMMSDINPHKVMAALIWLKEHNPLYTDIEINHDWLNDLNTDPLWEYLAKKDHPANSSQVTSQTKQVDVQQDAKHHPMDQVVTDNVQHTTKPHKQDIHVDVTVAQDLQNDAADEECACEQRIIDHNSEISLQPFATCLQIDAVENAIFCVAPGEGSKPRYILTDEDFEALAFPDLFPTGNYGTTGTSKVQRIRKLDMRRYFNQRLLNVDGRFGKSIEYVLAAQYATELHQVQGNIYHALKLRQGIAGQKINAGMLRNPQIIQQLQHTEQAYKVLQSIRGTPAFWQLKLLECYAMLRTLGPPTFFVTFSCADYHWPEIIQAVGHQYNRNFSDQDVENMNWATKSLWLRRNPVTAVRAFQHRFNAIHSYIMSKAQPLGHVVEFVEKVEFQARGSPHVHAIYWVQDAPVFGDSNDVTIQRFHDTYISAKIPPPDDALHDIVKSRQMHQCSKYCQRHKSCRFGFPKMPVKQTTVTRGKISDVDVESFVSHMSKLKTYLDDNQNVDTSIDNMLASCSISDSLYEALLAGKTEAAFIHVERQISDVRVNQYNRELLHLWKANMDIQFVQDAMSAVIYICSYLLKAEKGMGELLRTVAKEIRDQDIQTQLKTIGRVFLESREVSAQEAVMRILSMPLINKSRSTVFISSEAKHKRIRVPRPDLQQLDDADEDVFATTIHDRYEHRPTCLENMCLVEFASWYQTKYNSDPASISEHVSSNNADANLPRRITLAAGKGEMRKRMKQAVIRWHQHNRQKDPQGFFYERLLLFVPWRSEAMFSTDTEKQYLLSLDVITHNANKFSKYADDVEEASSRLSSLDNIEHLWNQVAPNAQMQDLDALHEGTTLLYGADDDTPANVADDGHVSLGGGKS